MLPTPKFHHLHLNSTDPDAAIAFYTRQFASTAKGSWGGFPALKSPNDVMVLFDKVDRPPVSQPQSAIWHFGWHVTDSRRSLETYKTRPKVEVRVWDVEAKDWDDGQTADSILTSIIQGVTKQASAA